MYAGKNSPLVRQTWAWCRSRSTVGRKGLGHQLINGSWVEVRRDRDGPILVRGIDEAVQALCRVGGRRRQRTRSSSSWPPLRSALLGAGRVLYVLGPSSPEAREANARMVLRQEARSLMRAYRAFEQFKQFPVLVPPANILAAQRERDNEVRGGARAISEEQTLMAMTTVIGEILLTVNDDPDNSEDELVELMTWIFNVYSGVAHGFGWPGLVPPRHVLGELYMVTWIASLGVV